MALLAEELVEEWLNRQGFFTIRGLKLGVAEMDLLGIRPIGDGIECRHLEVQASINPVSYIAPLTRTRQKAWGCGAYSAKRRPNDCMVESVTGWITKKFRHPRKLAARARLCSGPWSDELVVNGVKYPEELKEIEGQGIRIHHLKNIVQDLPSPSKDGFTAAGNDFENLLLRPAAEPLGRI